MKKKLYDGYVSCHYRSCGPFLYDYYSQLLFFRKKNEHGDYVDGKGFPIWGWWDWFLTNTWDRYRNRHY